MLLIHVVFCVQAYLPLQQGGMVSDGPWLWIYYPHYLLVFFLPPQYPISFSGSSVRVNYLEFWGKMLVAVPASAAYGMIVAAIASALLRLQRHGCASTTRDA